MLVITLPTDTASQSKLYFGHGSQLASLSGDWSKLSLTNYTLDSDTSQVRSRLSVHCYFVLNSLDPPLRIGSLDPFL